MRAMIFAAGLGTRLRPLTNDKPKALVEVHGKTLLQLAIEQLKRHGVQTFVINIHHFGQQVLDYLEAKQNFGCQLLISDERAALLETGGGLRYASSLLDNGQPFFLYNADIISNINLGEMLNKHNENGALATLAVRKRESSRYLRFDKKGTLCGWKNTKTGEEKIIREAKASSDWAFSGIHVISPTIFKLMHRSGKFSIIDSYLDLGRNYDIQAYPHDEDYWFDVGSIEKLQRAKTFLAKHLF